MFEYPAATPLDDAALAICAARGLNPPTPISTEDPGAPTNRQVAACAAAHLVNAYIAAITKNPTAIHALDAAITARDTATRSPAEALIDAMRASLPTTNCAAHLAAAIADTERHFGNTPIPIAPIDPALAITGIDAYLDGLASEPFFAGRIELLIYAHNALGLTPARAGLRGINPVAIAALFPSDKAEFYADPLTGTGVIIDHLGGNCPVQAEGTVDGVSLYFRARGNRWEIWIGDQKHLFALHPDIWSYRQPYRTWPDAGWMPEIVARMYIAEGISRWREWKKAQSAAQGT